MSKLLSLSYKMILGKDINNSTESKCHWDKGWRHREDWKKAPIKPKHPNSALLRYKKGTAFLFLKYIWIDQERNVFPRSLLSAQPSGERLGAWEAKNLSMNCHVLSSTQEDLSERARGPERKAGRKHQVCSSFICLDPGFFKGTVVEFYGFYWCAKGGK